MNQNRPSIGIVVPAFNNEHTILHCLESIASQTFLPSQVILADDASTDRTLEIVSGANSLGLPLKITSRSLNVGLGKNVAAAVALLSTDYFTKLDADDVYLNRRKLENELDIAQSFGHDIIPYSITPRIDDEGNVIFVPRPDTLTPAGVDILYRTVDHMPREMLIPIQALRSVGGYPTKPKLYVDWWLKTALAGKFKFICTGEIGAGYRVRSGESVPRMSKRPPLVHSYWLTRGFLANVKAYHRFPLGKDILFLGKLWGASLSKSSMLRTVHSLAIRTREMSITYARVIRKTKITEGQKSNGRGT